MNFPVALPRTPVGKLMDYGVVEVVNYPFDGSYLVREGVDVDEAVEFASSYPVLRVSVVDYLGLRHGLLPRYVVYCVDDYFKQGAAAQYGKNGCANLPLEVGLGNQDIFLAEFNSVEVFAYCRNVFADVGQVVVKLLVNRIEAQVNLIHGVEVLLLSHERFFKLSYGEIVLSVFSQRSSLLIVNCNRDCV